MVAIDYWPSISGPCLVRCLCNLHPLKLYFLNLDGAFRWYLARANEAIHVYPKFRPAKPTPYPHYRFRFNEIKMLTIDLRIDNRLPLNLMFCFQRYDWISYRYNYLIFISNIKTLISMSEFRTFLCKANNLPKSNFEFLFRGLPIQEFNRSRFYFNKLNTPTVDHYFKRYHRIIA